MKKAGDFLKEFFDNLGIPSEKRETIFSCWAEIAGKDIAEHSKVIDIKKEIVFVETDHPGWLQIINFKKEHILNKINEKFPEKEAREIKVILKRN